MPSQKHGKFILGWQANIKALDAFSERMCIPLPT
jgi:hypothetical protein